MRIKIKTLSPVHIGSGNEISPLEYFIKDKKFNRIDMESLFSDPEFEKEADKFIEKAKNIRRIEQILNERLLIKHILYSLDISKFTEKFNPIQVKEYIKTAGKVYIPGSSLKGAILSGVLTFVLSRKKIGKIKGKDFDDLLKISLTEMKKEESYNMGKFTRWLDVRDSDLKKPEEFLELSLVKIVGARTRTSVPVLYETLKSNIDFET
ncbi:MAG: type III-A CRISPR-associated RAMP protein Csm5, partial [Candidatus Ratteibacteria bacterium]